jgi:tripartite-type tricarboxylate transporter receptor subunit TctC
LKRNRIAGFITIAVLLLAVGLHGLAQGYPERPVTLMIHVSAGGGTDTGFRILSAVAEKYLGQPIVVVNKPGGSGFVCWEDLIRRAPDGYTISNIATPTLTYGYLDPEMDRKVSLDDFTPLVNHVVDPCVIAVPADSRFSSIQELIAFAKDNPEELAAAMSGVTSDDYMACQLVERATGAKFNNIHFAGAAPALTAAMGNHTDLVFANVSELKTPHENGELRTLVVLADKQTDFLPGVPTFEEALGIPLAMGSARGIVAPANLPQEIADVLIEAFRQAVEDPEHVDRMERVGLPINFMAGDEYKDFLVKQETIVKELMGW